MGKRPLPHETPFLCGLLLLTSLHRAGTQQELRNHLVEEAPLRHWVVLDCSFDYFPTVNFLMAEIIIIDLLSLVVPRQLSKYLS